MRSFRRISKPPMALAAALMLAATGCDPVTGPESSLNEARSRWEKQALDDYSFRYRRLCFCPSESVQPVIVTVRRDTIADVVYADTREQIPRNRLTEYRTIDGLFTMIQNAVDRNADEIDVTYDPTKGYPVNAAFDYEKEAFDDELSFTVDSVQALQ